MKASLHIMVKARTAILVAVLCFAWALDESIVYADNGTYTGCPGGGGNGLPFWDIYKTWTDWEHTHVSQYGDSISMKLDNTSAAAFGSLDMYYTGRLSIHLQLSCSNTSGTVVAFYSSANSTNNTDPGHDELDFEFLGNGSAADISVQTNVWVNGTGNREMRHNLWFNPCEDYHEYWIQWNSKMVLFGVDTVPIRVFMNYQDQYGIPYLSSAQGVSVSIWDGSTWATCGGRIKIDYGLNAPFQAYLKNFDSLDGCKVWNGDIEPCKYPATPHCWEQTQYQSLTDNQKNLLNWVANNYCTYDYCTDPVRFHHGANRPLECYHIPY